MSHYFSQGISTWCFCSDSLQKHVTCLTWIFEGQFWKEKNQTFLASNIHYALVPCMHLIVNRYCGDLQVISESAEAGGDGGQSSSRAVRSSVFIAAAQRRACGRSGLSLSRSSSTTPQPQHEHPGGQHCHYSPLFDPKAPRRKCVVLVSPANRDVDSSLNLRTSTISDSQKTWVEFAGLDQI